MNILRHLEGTRVITEIGTGEGHVMMEVKVGLMTFFFFFFAILCDLQGLTSPTRD